MPEYIGSLEGGKQVNLKMARKGGTRDVKVHNVEVTVCEIQGDSILEQATG
jgi:hypothetical protein